MDGLNEQYVVALFMAGLACGIIGTLICWHTDNKAKRRAAEEFMRRGLEDLANRDPDEPTIAEKLAELARRRQ